MDQRMLQPSPSRRRHVESCQAQVIEEMGIETDLNKIFSFTYKSKFDNGLTEFEFDHVFTGNTTV
jgi:isopentenyl-diphosphate delta-isomerase